MFINLSKNKNCSQVIQYLKQYTTEEFQRETEIVGLIYESHFLDMEQKSLEILKGLNLENKKYIFALCISKGIQGNSLYRIKQTVEATGYELDYIEHIIIGENISGEASFQGEKKSSELEEKIKNISQELNQKRIKKINTSYSKCSSFFSKIVRISLIYHFLQSSLDSNQCRKCGHCRGVCPTQKKIQKSS